MMYAIRDWATLYENCETKKRINLGWVLVPNRHDSLAFCRLMAKGEEGLVIFAVWNLVLQLASRGNQGRRGFLCSDTGEPYTALDIAVKTRAPEAAISKSLDILVELGWLIQIDESERPPDKCESHSDMSADDAKQVRKKERKKERKPHNHGGDLKIPKELETKAFEIKWDEWTGHLRAKGTPSSETLKAHLEELRLQPAHAVERLQVAIELGYRKPASRISEQAGSKAKIIQIEELNRKIKEA